MTDDLLKSRVSGLVKNYSSIGMTWHDVLLAASVLHERKVHEILSSTFSSLSLAELLTVIEHAKGELSPKLPEPLPPEAVIAVKPKRKAKGNGA